MPALRTVATALAASRIAFGAGMVLAPGLAARSWVGAGARDDRMQILARAMGVRDLAVGTAALAALRSDEPARIREWFGIQTATDAVDLLATVAAGPRTPTAARLFAGTLAAASVAVAAATAARAR